MTHSHFNPGVLTFGCAACIERVKRDQLRAAAVEVVRLFDGYLSWPSIPCADRLGAIEHDWDLADVIKDEWIDQGYDYFDLEDMMWYWRECRERAMDHAS